MPRRRPLKRGERGEFSLSLSGFSGRQNESIAGVGGAWGEEKRRGQRGHAFRCERRFEWRLTAVDVLILRARRALDVKQARMVCRLIAGDVISVASARWRNLIVEADKSRDFISPDGEMCCALLLDSGRKVSHVEKYVATRSFPPTLSVHNRREWIHNAPSPSPDSISCRDRQLISLYWAILGAFRAGGMAE